MICRLAGRVEQVDDQAAVIRVGGLFYEVLVPAASLAELGRLVGEDITLYTIQYLEGNPTGTVMIPRLIGFLSEAQRDFYNAFVRVKGISMRRALRAMILPVHQLAAAIENGDVHTLTTLPEIGKKTAAHIISELRGHLEQFATPSEAPRPPATLTEAQQVALEILVQWGDRRNDAQRWITLAVEHEPDLSSPEEIVRAAYKVKHGTM